MDSTLRKETVQIKPRDLPSFSMDDLEEVKSNIKKIAEENGYEVSGNLDNIAKAKLRFFGKEQFRLCPCDRNSDRACISEHCKRDIETDGICHCSLMKKKS